MESFEALIDINEVQTAVIDQVQALLRKPGPVSFGRPETTQLLRALLALKKRRPTAFSKNIATNLVCDCPLTWMVIFHHREFFHCGCCSIFGPTV